MYSTMFLLASMILHILPFLFRSYHDYLRQIETVHRFKRYSYFNPVTDACTCTIHYHALHQVYKLQYDQNMRAKEDRASSQHERTLQEHFVRTSPLGSDRRGALYWAFAGDERLFVQEKVPLAPGEVKGPRPPRAALSKLDAPSAQPTVEERDAQVLWRLYERRPHRFRYRWSVYCGGLDQWQLWDALDDRGEKERELRARLKARFDIEEPQQQYEIEGSDFVGRKVRRVFGKRVSTVLFCSMFYMWIYRSIHLPPTPDYIAATTFS